MRTCWVRYLYRWLESKNNLDRDTFVSPVPGLDARAEVESPRRHSGGKRSNYALPHLQFAELRHSWGFYETA